MRACRCYIALAQAVANLSCGSLIGPSGVGKTETIKDMANGLGKFVVIFGCSYQIGVLGLERIFKGFYGSEMNKVRRICLQKNLAYGCSVTGMQLPILDWIGFNETRILFTLN